MTLSKDQWEISAALKSKLTFGQTREVLACVVEQRDQMLKALESISNNTCCDKCQEAALVARAAIKEGSAQ